MNKKVYVSASKKCLSASLEDKFQPTLWLDVRAIDNDRVRDVHDLLRMREPMFAEDLLNTAANDTHVEVNTSIPTTTLS